MHKIKSFAYDVDITKEHRKVYGGSLDQMSINFMLKAPSKVVSKHCMQCFLITIYFIFKHDLLQDLCNLILHLITLALKKLT